MREKGCRLVAKSKKKKERRVDGLDGRAVAKSKKREEELTDKGCRAVA